MNETRTGYVKSPTDRKLDLLSAGWEDAEARLTRPAPITAASVCYHREDDGTEHLLGVRTRNGVWRLQCCVRKPKSKKPTVKPWRPVLEASVIERVRAVAGLAELIAKVESDRRDLPGLIDEALNNIEDVLR